MYISQIKTKMNKDNCKKTNNVTLVKVQSYKVESY